MEIFTIPFEKPLRIELYGEVVEVMAFKTNEPENVKFGIIAPKTLKVHREEVYKAILRRIQEKQDQATD